jgi:Uma2 family endonuclease
MVAAAKKHPPLMTVDEFLAWPGDGLGTRYELVDGELRAQDAPSDGHGTVHSNVVGLLRTHLRAAPSRCRVVIGGGIRPHLRSDWNYRIPDIAVTCAPNLPGVRDVPEPKLLIELLSPTNKDDTWDNVRNYVTLPSVEEIILIATWHAEADILRRGPDGHWPKNPLNIRGNAPVTAASVGLDMPMREIYWGTHIADGLD